MKYQCNTKPIIFIFFLSITACTPVINEKSAKDQIIDECGRAGFKGAEHEACVSEALKSYEKVYKKRIEDYYKMQKDNKDLQAKYDKGVCKSYGFKENSDDFANCRLELVKNRNLMNIEDVKIREQRMRK